MTVQELISNYWKTPYNNKPELYQKILREFFNLEKLYILVSPKCKCEDIDNGKWKPYISEDGSGEFTIRVFTEEKIAKTLAKKFSIVKDGRELIAPITIPELIIMTRDLMYNGLESIVIDEGANFLREHTSKLLKCYYEYMEEPDLYKGETLEIVSMLNSVWRRDNDVYIIPRPDTTILDEMDKKVRPIIEEIDDRRVLKVFSLKFDAEKYGTSKGWVSQNNIPYNIELNRYYFYNSIIDLAKDIDEIHIVRLEKTYRVSINELLKLMKDVGFLSVR
jgi:hypothetical protein